MGLVATVRSLITPAPTAAPIEPRISPVFGTVWRYSGSVLIALYPAPNVDKSAWWMVGAYEGAKPLVMWGFHGGDPDKRIKGYERLETK